LAVELMAGLASLLLLSPTKGGMHEAG